MNFERFFRLSSYALLAGGLLSLVVAGGVGVLVTLLFAVAMAVAWFLEDTKWQFSERTGLIVIFAALPLFYLDYKFHLSGGYPGEQAAVATLARLILALAAIKLLQVKTDRDWFVLYVISFFEVLLAAGFSISFFLAASFVLYLFLAVTAIITFEIRRSSRSITDARKRVLKKDMPSPSAMATGAGFRFPSVALGLLLLTIVLAVPLFFFLPRVGSAGIGAGSNALVTSTGFSESVTLGSIARIQQNDQVVMRVRIDSGQPPNFRSFKWRGVALDTFDRHRWSKARTNPVPLAPIEGNFFRLDTASRNNQTILQTIILEPLDTPVLFGLPRMLGVQGGFDSVTRDVNESVTAGRTEPEIVSYRVISDTYLPPEEDLRRDNAEYPADKKDIYLQLPSRMDPRIEKLARDVIERSGAKDRYDSARAIESYLQTSYGYTLDLRAGGSDPLADFLFNVKEGHCEYFASAMAIMLRTQGIATRIVNGFQSGEYNDVAGKFIVRQKDAHSWVEVYFPGQNVWVPFDPTPAAGQQNSASSAGFFGAFGSYMEALESMWVEYVVAYDNQGQRSLAKSLKQNFSSEMFQMSAWMNTLQRDLTKSFNDLRDDEGSGDRAGSVLYLLAFTLPALTVVLGLFFAARRFVRAGGWRAFFARFRKEEEARIVEFYARMITALKEKGFERRPYQTPLEFASSLAIPEAMQLTVAYNDVRFGQRDLNRDERTKIESWLNKLESKERGRKEPA
jgi:protein-glutamine gamma-glutamyltransferase